MRKTEGDSLIFLSKPRELLLCKACGYPVDIRAFEGLSAWRFRSSFGADTTVQVLHRTGVCAISRAFTTRCSGLGLTSSCSPRSLFTASREMRGPKLGRARACLNGDAAAVTAVGQMPSQPGVGQHGRVWKRLAHAYRRKRGRLILGQAGFLPLVPCPTPERFFVCRRCTVLSEFGASSTTAYYTNDTYSASSCLDAHQPRQVICFYGFAQICAVILLSYNP
jgi:hypothetical protein